MPSRCFLWRYFVRRCDRQIEFIAPENEALYDQVDTALQSSRLLSYHLDLQMQTMYDLFNFVDVHDEDPELE